MCTLIPIFAFYGYVGVSFLCFIVCVCLFAVWGCSHLYCLVGCFSMIVWTHAVLGVLPVYVLDFVLEFVQHS